MKICVYGSSSTELEAKYIDAVYELGKQMAERGIGLVFGGGAQGLMGAAARGVRDGGGEIVCTGTPEEVAQCAASFTGQYLKRVL